MPEPAAPAQALILRRLMLPRAVGGRLPGTVAVVGNAPVPASAERAERIDAADLVVRMTTFALDDDEPAIGRRTDVVVLHRAVAPGPDTFRDHARRLYLLAEPGRGWWEDERLPPWWPRDLELVPISNREFTSRTRAAMGLAPGSIAWPTTGTLAVHLVRGLFPHARILLAGSSLLARPGGQGFDHRWGARVRLTPEHRLAREARALRRWTREGWLEVLP